MIQEEKTAYLKLLHEEMLKFWVMIHQTKNPFMKNRLIICMNEIERSLSMMEML
jgi:hypothetical protein